MPCRGGYWASLRSALQPVFHSGALASYSGIMGDAADRLVARVGEAARGGGAVLLHTLAGRMTMEVIGQTAFGCGGQRGAAGAAGAAGAGLSLSGEGLFFLFGRHARRRVVRPAWERGGPGFAQREGPGGEGGWAKAPAWAAPLALGSAKA